MSRTFSTTRRGVEHTWNVEELWAMQFPTRAFPLSAFDQCLDWDVWQESLTPKTLLQHYKRTMEADMFYPILVCLNKEGKILHLIDGMHRLVKAYAKGYERIAVQVVTEDVLYEIPHEVGGKFCETCECIPCDCHWGDY